MRHDETFIPKAVRDMLDARRYPQQARYLVAAMEDVQAGFGYVPAEAASELARYFSLDEAKIAAWLRDASGAFRAQPLGRHVLRICQGPICRTRGGKAMMEEVRKVASGKSGLTVLASHCLGACDQAPIAKLDEERLSGHGDETISALVLTAISNINGEDGEP